MDYEKLPQSYWSEQIARIKKILEKINSQDLISAAGRIVPNGEELVIGTGRTMNMAIMFLDISGFSSRPSEEIDEQQKLLQVLNLFFTEMVRISEDYGGTVEKNTGDGLMAYFEDRGGDPPDGGTKRAVSCALTMMYANDYLINPILKKTQIPDIKFRITIDHGPITIARLGAARRFNALVAIGTKANIASKMLSFAQAGDIILGDQAYQRLPIPWKIKWTELLTESTGWVYRISGKSYPFYKYNGRWTGPL